MQTNAKEVIGSRRIMLLTQIYALNLLRFFPFFFAQILRTLPPGEAIEV